MAWLLQIGWLQADVQAHDSNRNTTCALITQSAHATHYLARARKMKMTLQEECGSKCIKEVSLILPVILSYTPLTTQGNQLIRDINARP